jgi:ABC-type phosphate transport system auxiliary subunit
MRVGQFLQASKGLDWEAIANITGELGTVKKTIQTLNNRLNGMHSPKLQEQELMLELLKRGPNQVTNGQIKNVGG